MYIQEIAITACLLIEKEKKQQLVNDILRICFTVNYTTATSCA